MANSQRTSALETYAASNTSRIQTLEANVALTGPYLTQNSERVSVLESLVPTKAPIHGPVFTESRAKRERHDRHRLRLRIQPE